MKTDLAVVNYGPKPYSVDLLEVPLATIDDDQVLLEVQSVGVCGSDLHMWTAQQSWAVNYPVVLGHEFCGTICQVGKNVRGWREGDRVVSETAAVIDPDSPLTRQGLYNLDPGRRGFGAMIDGAMRQYVPVPARILHRMPDGMTFDQACADRAVVRGVQRHGHQCSHSAWRSNCGAGAGANRHFVCGNCPAERRGGGPGGTGT